MKKLLTASLLASAAVASAAPNNTIVQTQNYTITGGSGLQQLIFDQFNSNLYGSLLSVSIESTGTLSGSFTVTKTGAGTVTVKDSNAQMYLGFLESGPSLASTVLTPISTNPVTDSTGSTVGTGTTTFSILGSQVLSLSSTDLTSLWSSWFTGTGTRTVEVTQGIGTTLVGFNKSDDYSGVDLSGSVTLTYTYAPVPEPSTYGIILGGLALAGAVVARRRKQAK